MDDEFEAFIEAQKAHLAQERKDLTNEPMKRNGFKENRPPKPMTPDIGLVAKLGGYSEKRQKLQEERRQEYNRMLAKQKMKLGGNSSRDTNEFAPQSNDQRKRDPDYDHWNDDRPLPPRKGWATPTYQEILDRKRKQERNYRRMDDPFDRTMKLGDPDYNRMSLSEGNLNQTFNEENERLVALDREFEQKKVRFMNDRRPLSNPDDDSSYPYNELQSQYNQPKKNSQPPDVPPQTIGRNLRKTGSEPENFHGTLMIGQELRVSQDRRKKEAYRQELEHQMEEAKARKLREKMEKHQVAEGLMDRMVPGRLEPPRPPAPASTVAFTSGFPSSLPPQLSPMYAMQTKNAINDDLGLGKGGGRGFDEDRASGYGGILSNGFNLNASRPHLSNAPPENNSGLMPSLNPYSSPLNDAYFYYGMQNPLDPNLAHGVPGIQSLVPPAQVMPGYPVSRNPVMDHSHQTLTHSPPGFLRPSAAPPPSIGPGSNFRRDAGGILGENPDERKRAEEEKKRMYQMELQKQMEEDKLKKHNQKEEQQRYDKKLEEEIAKYSPFGQPGGGAPMRNKFGDVITTRRPEIVAQALAQNTPPHSHVAADRQMAELADPYNPFGQDRPSVGGDPFLDLYRSPFSDVETAKPVAYLSSPGLQDHVGVRADGESKFSRGGHGIFGEPMTEEQKNVKQRYQDELRQQIEEKKKRGEEEKRRQQKEEELLLKHIEEDKLKIQKEQEEEKRKLREKAEQAERQQQELKRQQEEQRQEAEQKKKDAQEARQQEQLEIRHQEDKNRYKAEELERIKSPPIPAAAVASRSSSNVRSAQQRKSSPVPFDRTKSQQSRVDSARALDHLARMKEKLHSERKRVESDLKKEQMAPEVFDPRLVIGRPPRHNDAGIFEMMRRNNSSTREKNKGPTSHHVFEQQEMPSEASEGFHGNHVKKGHSAVEDGLEEWQRWQLEEQKEELKTLKQRSTSTDDIRLGEGQSRPGSSLLEAQTEFLGIPDSRADNDHIPDDLEDMKKRQMSASNRRHRKAKISIEDDPPLSRMGSVTSLDPEELKRKNEERLKKLKSLEGDDVSSGNPDDILEHFMEKRKHGRPPSSNTLMDDSWLSPGRTGL